MIIAFSHHYLPLSPLPTVQGYVRYSHNMMSTGFNFSLASENLYQ